MSRARIPQNTFALVRIERDLVRFVGSQLSQSEAARLAEGLHGLPGEVTARVFAWTEIFARLHTELAAGFVRAVEKVARATQFEGYEHWGRRAAEAFDHRGLGAALAVINDPDGFVAEYQARARGCDFESCRRRLTLWLTGLGPPILRLVRGPRAVTDTECIWLPSQFHRLDNTQENYRLYQSLAAFLWAQARYETWSAERLFGLLRQPDLEIAVERFMALETARLVACLKRDYPGVATALYRCAQAVDGHTDWLSAPARFGLSAPPQDAAEALALARDTAGSVALPAVPCFRGAVDLSILRARVLAGSREVSRVGLTARAAQAAEETAPGGHRAPRPGAAAGTTEAAGQGSARAGVLKVQLEGDLASSSATPGGGGGIEVVNSETERRPASLTAGGQHYDPRDRAGSGASTAGYDRVAPEEVVEFVSEWDHERACYRDDYCTVRIRPGDLGDAGFVPATLERHRGMIKSIKRRFESLVGAPVVQRHQVDGDEIDVDALIEAHADRQAGRSFSEHVYRRRVDHGRDIAALFLVDMSGSTRGWVNQAEREALVLLCEAFSLLGDRYAIYGFSGRTHKRCDVFAIKAFGDRYDEQVKRRIAGIAPKGYTRLGAPIRCLSRRLAALPARHRLLVTITDGKPEDYRSYRGAYGIEDTRRALTEARRSGINAFCLTIDEAGGDYLPRMYGPANYVVLDDVMQLPYKLADVYRKLTS